MSVNVEVVRKENESIERMLKRFMKKVKKEGIMEELRDRSFYKKPSDVKRRKKERRKRIARDVQRKIEEKLNSNN